MMNTETSWFDIFYKGTTNRKERIQQGIPTIIPFKSFDRLAKFIPGIIPGEQIIICANTGVGC